MFRPGSLAHLPSRLVAAGACLACLAGVALAVAASTPENLIESPDTGAALHGAHGLLGLSTLGAALLVLAAGVLGRTRALDAALTLGALAAFVPALPLVPDEARLPLGSVAFGLVAVVGLAVTRHGLRTSGFTPRHVGLGTASVAQGFAAAALLFGGAAGLTIERWVTVLLAGALGALADPAPGEEPRVLMSATLVLFAVVVHAPFAEDGHPALAQVLVQLAVGGLVAAAVLSGTRRRFPGTAARLAVGLSLLFFLSTLAGRVLFAAAGANLADTLYVTALGHAAWLTGLTAVLAEALRAREPRPGLRHAPAAGVALAGTGGFAFLLAYAHLGMNGMPRAYLRYIDGFTTGHIVGAAGATLWALGMLMVLTTTRRAHEAPAAAEVFA